MEKGFSLVEEVGQGGEVVAWSKRRAEVGDVVIARWLCDSIWNFRV